MNRALLSLALIGLPVMALGVQVPRGASSGSYVAAVPAADREVRIFIDRVNDYRESIGCPRLIVDLRAQTVAENHSEDMHERRYVAHVNPDGDDYMDRLRSAGVSFSIAAENVAQTSDGGEGVLQRWLASRPHRVNIQNCAFLRHGVGRYENMWTHVLFRE